MAIGDFMKKIYFILCICAFVSGSLHAQQQKKDGDTMIPADSMIQQAISSTKTAEKSFTVIKSEVIPYPASWTKFSEKEKQLRLFNILNRLSTQKGITYISRRAGYKPKVLFTDSYYTETVGKNDTEQKEKSKRKISDPVCTELPQHIERFAEQDDSTFGDNEYRHVFTNTEKETLLTVTNLTPLKYHGITCVKEGEFTVYTSVMQSKEGIVVTSATIVNNHDKIVKILFLNVNLESSFSRRMDAAFTWYRNQLSLEK